ncbi:MAG: hypothetical protein K9J51_11620 [Desulfotignum sp.]|nr:hypothetical protein [Desulfotignum sp.]
MSDFPILKCFPINKEQVKAWCPFCNKWHIHGYTDDIKENKASHRTEHCLSPDSPFKNGYRLKKLTQKEKKEFIDNIDL